MLDDLPLGEDYFRNNARLFWILLALNILFPLIEGSFAIPFVLKVNVYDQTPSTFIQIAFTVGAGGVSLV
jgi:hypothetical protein